MSTVTVSPKYQVVIPKDVRDRMGVKVGMKLEIVTLGNRIELIPIESISRLKGLMPGLDTDIEREDDRI